MDDIRGVRLAALVAPGFEEVELFSLTNDLEPAGVELTIVAPHRGGVSGFRRGPKFSTIIPDSIIQQENPDRYDALFLCGGRFADEILRHDPRVVQFVSLIQDAWKPIGAVGHAPWVLLSAGLVIGRTLTSSPTLIEEIRGAGGNWVDGEAVVDHNWLTSRGPFDMPAFLRAFRPLLGNAKAIFHAREPLLSREARSVAWKARIV